MLRLTIFKFGKETPKANNKKIVASIMFHILRFLYRLEFNYLECCLYHLARINPMMIYKTITSRYFLKILNKT